jgi:hypothetical protein
MTKRATSFRATVIALAFAGMAAGQASGAIQDSTSAEPSTTLTSPGQLRVASKFAAPFTTLAGSQENAVALATALRTGTPVTLTYTTTVDGKTTTTTTTFTPPTKPMGWGNVSHALALAQYSLNQQGITNPTGAQLQAALLGGDITTSDGKTVTLAGVLQQRADGMGWGKIAQSYGTTMGAVNRGIKAPAVATTSTTTAATTTAKSTSVTSKAVVTKASPATAAGTTSVSSGAPARGLTTAGGTAAGAGPGAKGLTTASGATTGAASSGIVTADGGSRGDGNAYGHGVVTGSGGAVGVAAAGGTSSGIVTGAGTTGSGVVTANPGQGGAGNAHGKGKGGG